LLEELIASGDAPPEASLYLGRSYHALGDYTKALSAYRDFIIARPRSANGYLFAGRSYLALGMMAKAVSLLKRCLELKPDDPAALALLGTAYLKGRKSALALESFRQAVDKAPLDARVYRGYLNALLVRGIRLARSGDENLAAQMLRFAIANGLDAVLPRLELGRIYRNAGDLRSALEQYEAASSFVPDDTRIRWYKASLLMALGNSEAAKRELRAIRESGGDIPDLAWNQELVERFLIRSLVEARDWRRAAEACRIWLKTRDSDAAVHAMLAESLRNLGDLDTAENHARRAISKEPKEGALRLELALVLWEKGDWERLGTELDAAERIGTDRSAIVRFRALHASKVVDDDARVVDLVQAAIRISGPVPELMRALAERYLKLGLPDLAEGWYLKTLRLTPEDESAALGAIACAEALRTEGEPTADKRLEAAYEAYVTRWPDNPAIRREYGMLLLRGGSFSRAASQFEALLAWDGKNARLRRVLALAYRKDGRFTEAAVLLKSLLKERPRDPLILLEFTHCLEKAGSRGYAISVLQKALPLFPNSSEPCLTLGDLLRRSKRKEAAVDAYREAAARDASDPRPYERLSEYYRKSGIGELALRYEEEARRRGGAGTKK
jgi:tetratricopeptide (TPR) repeat protein